jgi:UDP-2,3-diacylglucosamine pyrophosphatase LpxH
MADKKMFYDRMETLPGGENKYVRKLPAGNGYKYIVISDLHLGDGSNADNFKQNERVVCQALGYYCKKNYSVVLLGDVEEFHQMALYPIMLKYDGSVYRALREFSEERVYRVFGNHDIDWALEDPLFTQSKVTSSEAIMLGDHIVLTHGHQAREVYEKDLHVVRFGTTFFRFIENIIGSSEGSTVTALPGEKDAIYADWARERQKILVCGHTHNPISASRSMFGWIEERLRQIERALGQKQMDKADKKSLKAEQLWLRNKQRWLSDKFAAAKSSPLKLDEPGYFNSGGCIYHDGITCIEIDGPKIRLLYWNNKREQRELIWDEKDMNDVLNQAKGTANRTYIG